MVAQVTLAECWDLLVSNPDATLIDVRTAAEWNFVGVPELDRPDRQPRFVEWIGFPGGAANTNFFAAASEGLDPAEPVLFLCRSGARSQAAAEVFEAAGFSNVSNVSAGFEGDKGTDGHRQGGWKHSGLPWSRG